MKRVRWPSAAQQWRLLRLLVLLAALALLPLSQLLGWLLLPPASGGQVCALVGLLLYVGMGLGFRFGSQRSSPRWRWVLLSGQVALVSLGSGGMLTLSLVALRDGLGAGGVLEFLSAVTAYLYIELSVRQRFFLPPPGKRTLHS